MFNLVVLATTNKNKVREFQRFTADFPVEVKSLSDFGPLPPVVEDGLTFEANAYKKAHHYAKVLGIPAISDDSGLAVEALNGAPGVWSARFAGENATDSDNCAKLLEEMKGVENRKASFFCSLSIAVPSGPALTYEASCEGKILEAARGENGFGYDQLFFYEGLGKSFAEISLEQKNQVSHRGQVLQELRSEFDKVLKWIETRMMEEMPEQPDHEQFEGNDWSE
jgi:XTP/dITP diphosphohydrolase